MGVMRTKAARDQNETEIVDALRKAGYFVTRLNDPGVPDLLVLKHDPPLCKVHSPEEAFDAMRCVRGQAVLMEVKMPGKDLNQRQREWWKNAAGTTTL